MKDKLSTGFYLAIVMIIVLLALTWFTAIRPLVKFSTPSVSKSEYAAEYDIDDDFNYNLSSYSDDWYDEYCALEDDYNHLENEYYEVRNNYWEARLAISNALETLWYAEEDYKMPAQVYDAIEEAIDYLSDFY